MNWDEMGPIIDAIGYAGGALTLWGMYGKTMIRLRAGAVGGNVAFLLFGLLAGSYPTVAIHALLLPLNALRLREMITLVREIDEATEGDGNINMLIPLMHREAITKDTVLFRKGDKPDRMIIIHEGTVHLQEIDVDCGAGDGLGEMAAFTPEAARTCTAVCKTNCVLYTLTNEAMIQHYYQNARFGMFLLRLIVRRLVDNWQHAEHRAKSL